MALFVLFAGIVHAAPLPTPSSRAADLIHAARLPLLLRKLDRTARLLYVTAHPDDEDAGLIARLVHGEGVEVALLTLTRGEGGQNEIGTELFEALALLRSAELEAAHAFDGARQYFGSAADFGYSFSVEETLEKWHPQELLAELVSVVREFQPDVVITLNPEGHGGGQHHQASAQLTARALAQAADPGFRPELGPPHRARRLFRILWGDAAAVHPCTVPVGVFDPLLGATYAEIGDRSRSQHKCQGMVRLHAPFERRSARLDLLWDEDRPLRALSHPFAELQERHLETSDPEGVEPTAFGRELRVLAAAVRMAFRAERPAEVLALLGAVRERVLQECSAAATTGQHSAALDTARSRVDAAIAAALGLRLAARSHAPFVASGGVVPVTVTACNEGDRAVRLRIALRAGSETRATVELPLEPGMRAERELTLTAEPADETRFPLPAGPAPVARYTVACTAQVAGLGAGEQVEVSLPLLPIEHVRRREDFPTLQVVNLQAVPDPSVRPVHGVAALPLARRGGPTSRATTVEFRLSTIEPGEVVVEAALDEPGEGWSVMPRSLRVRSPGAGREVPLAFSISTSARSGAARAHLRLRAHRAGGEPAAGSDRGVRLIDFPHIRSRALVVPAAVEVVAFSCDVPAGRRVGYVEGSGDEVARAIEALGFAVDRLGAEDLLEGDLACFSAIVLGVRAYKVREDLAAAQPRLLEWVRAGGTLVVQYNKLEFNAGRTDGSSPFAPLPGASVGRRRVTVEESPVRLHDPRHPLFTTPNEIAPEDWRDWVQERGLYFLDIAPTARGSYRDLLVLEDPWPDNEGPKGGALVEARVGQGHWIYVGLGLFRQLPAGVPGAYRLLANLLAR